MKKIAFLTLFIFSSILTFSQETSVINIGVGMPVFFQQNFNETGLGTNNLNRKRIHLFVEKAFVFDSKNMLSIRPGVGYFLFNEVYESDQSALGGHTSKAFTHYAFSLYSKFFYHFPVKPKKTNQWCLGAVGGKYLYTKTTGNVSWWMRQIPHNVSGEKEINESGQAFFHSFYYGFIGGFDGKSKENARIAPAFEFSLYPDFVTVSNEKRWMAMISVILKVHKKSHPN